MVALVGGFASLIHPTSAEYGTAWLAVPLGDLHRAAAKLTALHLVCHGAEV